MTQFETRDFTVVFQEDAPLDCSMQEEEAFFVDFGADVEKEYKGPVSVTPGEETQTLQTMNRILTENITIEPVPAGYGRIAWDGSKIRVY